jgi:two-component system, chemotaxis family, protein-glutamate methylesterase/glutaminase
MNRDFTIAVVGASAGGVPALEALVAGIPADLDAAVFVVIHTRDDAVSHLAEILSRAGPLPASFAIDGEPIKPGRIYVSCPGHHLLIEDERVGVKAGPKENRFRPSIDALFRSAAYMCRERVLGVILSGALSDGASGLWTIKQFGGLTVVQDPKEAAYDDMPRAALEQVEIDYTLPVRRIGPLIATLTKTQVADKPEPPPEIIERTKREVDVAASGDSFNRRMMEFGELTPFTCPECHGALIQIKEGRLIRFRCHTGHGFTANALLSGVTDSVEASLWNALRVMEEAVMLLEHMAQHFDETGRKDDARLFMAKAEQTRQRARLVQKQAISAEHLSEANFTQGA